MNEQASKPVSKKRFTMAELIGVLIVVSLLAWFLLWPAFQNVRDSFSDHSWPATNAKVTISRKSKTTNGGGSTRVSYRFRYEYRVDHQTYTGWRYSLSYPSGSQGAGVKLHHEGQTIKVHYNPKHPSRSVINVESSTWWNYLVLGGTLFLGLIAVLINWSFRTPTPA